MSKVLTGTGPTKTTCPCEQKISSLPLPLPVGGGIINASPLNFPEPPKTLAEEELSSHFKGFHLARVVSSCTSNRGSQQEMHPSLISIPKVIAPKVVAFLIAFTLTIAVLAAKLVAVIRILLVPLISANSIGIRVAAQIRTRWCGDLRRSTNLTSMIAHGQVGILLHDVHETFVSLLLLGLLLRDALLATKCLPALQVLNLTSGKEQLSV